MIMSGPAAPFTIHDDLAPYAVPLSDWHRTHGSKYGGLVAAALVFDARGRVLLVRRAAHDFLPGHWEPPGGSVDGDRDESILHACVRELKEEASLVARRVECEVGEGIEFGIRDLLYRRLTFLVTVAGGGQVETDQQEHSEWVWAEEEEVKAERMADGRDMPVTFPEVKGSLLEGFRLHRGNSA